jgi:hypothetical protein
MFKTTLVAVLTLGTIAVASAQEFDPNLGNRYPAYNAPVAAHGWHSRNAAMMRGHAATVRRESYIDRASQSFDGGR